MLLIVYLYNYFITYSISVHQIIKMSCESLVSSWICEFRSTIGDFNCFFYIPLPCRFNPYFDICRKHKMSRLRYKAAPVRWNCSVASCDQQPRICRVRLLLLCLCVLVAMTLTLALLLSNHQPMEHDLPPRPPDLFKDKVRGLQTFFSFLFLCTF